MVTHCDGKREAVEEREEQRFDNPEFEIELNDENPVLGFEPQIASTPAMQPFGSPGFYFGTPSMNPFLFHSPETPKRYDILSNLPNIGSLSQNNFDDYQMLVQREIESNLNRGDEMKSMGSSLSTFGGSPGSAFRHFNNY